MDREKQNATTTTTTTPPPPPSLPDPYELYIYIFKLLWYNANTAKYDNVSVLTVQDNVVVVDGLVVVIPQIMTRLNH